MAALCNAQFFIPGTGGKNEKSGSIMETDDRFPTPPVFSLQTCPNKIKCAQAALAFHFASASSSTVTRYLYRMFFVTSVCIEVTCWDLYLKSSFRFPITKGLVDGLLFKSGWSRVPTGWSQWSCSKCWRSEGAVKALKLGCSAYNCPRKISRS